MSSSRVLLPKLTKLTNTFKKLRKRNGISIMMNLTKASCLLRREHLSLIRLKQKRMQPSSFSCLPLELDQGKGLTSWSADYWGIVYWPTKYLWSSTGCLWYRQKKQQKPSLRLTNRGSSELRRGEQRRSMNRSIRKTSKSWLGFLKFRNPLTTSQILIKRLMKVRV